jgi:hypothetical protein
MVNKIVPVICVVVQHRINVVLLCLWDRNIKFIVVPKEKHVAETIVVMFVAMVTSVVHKVQLVVAVDAVVQRVQSVVEVVVVHENAVMPMESA